MRIFERIRQELVPPKDEFDRAHGTRTAGVTSLWRLRIVSPNKSEGVRYQPVDPQLFRHGVREIPDRADFTFVDLGCGKGRGLVLARLEGFERVIGVEFAPSLARRARRNLKKLGLKGDVVVADAATYVFSNEPTVLFLYNPFGTHVLAQVLQNLHRIDAPVYVLYVNPVHTRALNGFNVVLDDPKVIVLRRETSLDEPYK